MEWADEASISMMSFIDVAQTFRPEEVEMAIQQAAAGKVVRAAIIL